MFDRVGILAERVASDVSRRAFFGRLGQGALGLAAVIAGVLALPSQALAADQCCVQISVQPSVIPCLFYKVGGRCNCFNPTSCSNVPAGCVQVKDCHKGFGGV
jgi:hypothetical protein